MSDLTPQAMLREYRRQSEDYMREQVAAFRSLSGSDQRELIFWMVMHLTASLQHVHSLVDSDAAATRDFKDIETKTN